MPDGPWLTVCMYTGIQKVCIVGYCYGLPIAIHFARQAGAVSAFAVAHGAVKLPDDVKQLQAPGFFACAEKDPMLPASARGHLQALIRYLIAEFLLVWLDIAQGLRSTG